MKIHDKDGNEVHITREEAEKISRDLKAMSKETNEDFTNRALDNIEKMTGKRPESEEEAKEILHDNIHMKDDELDLLYETVEAIVGWHSKNTKSM